jgi:uncharacterized protein YegP (UPF0339 family)
MRIIMRSGFLVLGGLLLLACSEQYGYEPPPQCGGGKCDDPTQAGQAKEPLTLMQKAPPGESAISRNKAGSWFFHTIGKRGERVLSSQAYVTRASSANGILAVEENGVDIEQYKVSQNSDGTWRFYLRAKNFQEIATSGSFTTEAEAKAEAAEARDLIAAILQFKAAMEKGARFNLKRSKVDKKWYFTLLDASGTEQLYSQGYQGRTAAVNGIQSVRDNGKEEVQYKQLGTSFILRAKNWQEIAKSGTYATAQEAVDGAKYVRQLLQSERVGNPW